ncbi:MAG TPA: AAA family ATPase [Actinomycetes bacterium]|nr:AAA family ATPase [Actinomycetes bacterium]
MPQHSTAPDLFVGRSVELARLCAALQDAGAGRGTIVLVAGDAGIGKTRLVAELSTRAGATGARVLTGRCLNLVGGGLPYLPFAEAFRTFANAPLPAGATGTRGDTTEPPGATSPQLLLFDRVRTFLEDLSVTASVVLVVEDLHWADLSTLDLLSYLATAVGGHRTLIVATYRSDEPEPVAPVHRIATELVRAKLASAIPLGPLAFEDVQALVDAGADPLTPERRDVIVQRSGGNPFFAEELRAAAHRSEDGVPRLIRDALRQRLSQLDPDTRAILDLASAVGRPVRYRLLKAVTRFPARRLDRALRQATERGVLVIDQPTGTVGFRHALLAETVYAALLPGEREAAHLRLARALVDPIGDPTDGAISAELARHWTAAGRPTEALQASLEAAAEAELLSGRAEALGHLERAIELWPAVSEAAELVGADLAGLLARAAELAYLTGSGRRGVDLVRSAIGLVEEAGAPVRTALLHERLGSYLLSIGDRDGGLAAFRRAVELVPATPPSVERVRVLAAFGHALMLSWRHADALAACSAAITAATALGADRAAWRALDVQALCDCYLGNPNAGLRQLREALTRSPTDALPPDLTRPYVFLSDALITAGQLDEALAVAEDGLALARRLGMERGVGTLLASNAAEAMLGSGRWDAAEAVLSAALHTRGEFWSYHPHRLRAQLATRRGEFDVARHHLAAGAGATREPNSSHYYSCRLAELALWEGRTADAAEAVRDGLPTAATAESAFLRVELCALGLWAQADRAQLAAARADRDELAAARRRANQLRQEAHRAARTAIPFSPDTTAWLAVTDAEHDRALGQPDPDRWQQAAAGWQRLGRPYQVAYCCWRTAEAHLAAGSPASHALAAARTAYAVAVELGAQPLRRQLELLGLRARFELSPADPDRSPDPRPSPLGLTVRETEVLALVARGYTNREIADAFTISVKTASVHVSHILRKLGVSSRVQAAEIAHRMATPSAG